MNRRIPSGIAITFIVVLILTAPGWLLGAERLNVLLLICDDCRAVQSCYGEPAATPHIDRLALPTLAPVLRAEFKFTNV